MWWLDPNGFSTTPCLKNRTKQKCYMLVVKGVVIYLLYNHIVHKKPLMLKKSLDLLIEYFDFCLLNNLSFCSIEPVTPWSMVQDEGTQYYYYWNYLTNEVTWEIPTEYTQYLLLHREYTERIAKFTPEQIQRHKERKSRWVDACIFIDWLK